MSEPDTPVLRELPRAGPEALTARRPAAMGGREQTITQLQQTVAALPATALMHPCQKSHSFWDYPGHRLGTTGPEVPCLPDLV